MEGIVEMNNIKSSFKNDKYNLNIPNTDILFYISPALLIVIIESICRLSIISTLKWIIEYFPYFILSYSFVLCLMLLFLSISNSYSKSLTITSMFLLLFGFTNIIKIYYLGSPLLPGDLYLVKNFSSLLSFLDIKLLIMLIPLTIIIIILTYYLINFISKKIFNNSGAKTAYLRVSLALITLAFIYFICFNNWFICTYIPSINMNLVQFSNKYFDSHGYLLSFGVNIRNTIHTAPKNYNVLEVSNNLSSFITEKKNTIKPNVIIVLSETFIDPTIFNGVQFSKDPTETFNLLCKDYTNGKMLTPTFGGYTSNVEFEILTGFSNRFLPESSIPYLHFINNKIDSIANVFKDNGYKTIGLHPFEKEFYNRYKVYPLLGFDKFISESDINNPQIKGGYISDDEFVNRIIYEFNNKGDNKIFLFGLTMQNHLPYFDGKYDNYDISVTSDLLSQDELDSFQAYIQGIYDEDKALEKLINYFSNEAEPTVVLFFGDHFPSFGNRSEIYEKLNFSKEVIDRYSTPFLIWSNYDTSREDIELTSSNLLGNQLLNYIGLTKNPYFEFLDELNNNITAMRTGLIIDKEGNVNPQSEKVQSLIKQYEQFEYYLMFDKYK
jgi:phosphoglycerol transferase MdoB-like AlkP superfamily enzyme